MLASLNGRLTGVRKRVHQWAVRELVRIPIETRGTHGIVSFSFDDFPKSAAASGGEILMQQGVRGTYFASMGLRDTDSPSGRIFDDGDLLALAEQGHEIGGHTYDHLRSHEVDSVEYAQSITRNIDAIQSLLPDWIPCSFAYPAGQVSLGAKRAVRRRYACARAIASTPGAGMGDAMLLSAVALYSCRMSEVDTRQMVGKAVRDRRWLVFYTHDVSTHPSEYGCTPDLLAAAVDAVQSMEARVLPIGTALQSFVLDDRTSELSEQR